MECFIRVKNGEPFGNPITKDNFIQAFPDVDIDNLPPEFARFIRLDPPEYNFFEVWEGTTYDWDGDVITDVHHIRPMTSGERYEKIEFIKTQRPNENWTWKEETLEWLPPKRPTTGGPWKWDQPSRDWVIATEPPFPSWAVSEDGTRYVAPILMPEDGKPYVWNEDALSWVEVDIDAGLTNG